MKKWIIMICVLALQLAFAGCGGRNETNMTGPVGMNAAEPGGTEQGAAFPAPESLPEIPAFSYAEDRKQYADDASGVKTTGFVNTSEAAINTISDAVDRAKNECAVAWDTVEVYFDSETGMWKVAFWTKGLLGGDQIVYLDKSGKTTLVVFGE